MHGKVYCQMPEALQITLPEALPDTDVLPDDLCTSSSIDRYITNSGIEFEKIMAKQKKEEKSDLS